MNGFVSAVKNWVKFELFLSIVGLISLIASALSIGTDYMSEQLEIIYLVSAFILMIRIGILIGVLVSGDEPKEEDGEVEEAKCDICNNGSCWKCKKKKKGGD